MEKSYKRELLLRQYLDEQWDWIVMGSQNRNIICESKTKYQTYQGLVEALHSHVKGGFIQKLLFIQSKVVTVKPKPND